VKSLKDRTIHLLFLFLIYFCHSCQKLENESIILISPAEFFISAQASKVVSITANCTSPVELKKFIISSQIEGSFSVKNLDTLISGKKFYIKFEYLVPDVTDSTKIIIEFTLIDANGGVVNNVRVLQVSPESKNLTETAGHEMFSGKSGKQNAYNLVDGIPLFSHLGDSTKMHIVDTSNSPSLIRRWISPAHARFVRFNGFDYPNCTNISIRNAFNAGIKTDFVDNLNQGDIILTKTIYPKSKDQSIEYFMAIKIVNIIDNSASEWDRYIFNIKK
jgi:hypothetical protein